MKIFSIKLLVIFLFTGCSNYGQLTFISKLPTKLNENSGIVAMNNINLWIIEDNGNTDNIYQVDFNGNLLKQLKVKDAKNRDWEDLTKDNTGNVYIADFGNNNNDRKDLVIYKIPNPEIEKGDKIDAEKIKFSYPEQKKFPPAKDGLLYDSEALFYYNEALYIITKNKSKPFTGTALIYKVPAKKGEYKATYVGKFSTCTEQGRCEVTSADISPDGKQIVLLGYGMLWVFTDFSWDDFSKGTMKTIDLGATTQLESLCFKDNNTLLLSDEARGSTGRNLYSYTLK